MYSNKKIVQSLGEILKAKSISHIIISPGSRNAPIIIHFTQHRYFKTYSIVDERCAGFFALGIAQKINKPVVLSCTSGSAVVNYYPSVTEAFYQNIPLIFLTADRPKEIINTLEGQTIHQENIFQNHVESSIQLTEDETQLGLWYNDRLINESINKCIEKKKPIHINIPFSEPLYETTEFLHVKPKIINTFPVKNCVEKPKYYRKEKHIWKKSKKKMILLGLYNTGKKLEKILNKLSIDPSIVIFTETTSHVYGKIFFSCIDQLLFSMKYPEWIKLRPHILLTIGGNIISKKIKFFLRNNPPKYHWHIGENNSKNYPDTYYRLTTYWPIKPEIFFKIFHLSSLKNLESSDYRYKWEKLRKYRRKKNDSFLKKEKSFSDLKVLFYVFKSIPNHSILQLGNSTIIRYYQLFDDNKKYSINSYCNRGTSGIEGSVSTAIGYAVSSNKKVTLIIGDISFFYDSNALWNNYTPNNFRIILINNGGGNIFRSISEYEIPEKILNFFETKHFFTAEKICEMHNWKYERVSNKFSLKKSLDIFWNKSDVPCLLEIDTQKSNNAKILKKYLSYLS
ncbi:2-succinyl-5-enolpyruvyl-6-hydroxy-3-cyclohexene-1-carboxylic-acid synthase [Blattabacterium cuenoti]|uniref:2-succinyl-5-enolpyruvyl-6-hydroxy-3- cyclohexene-1-carboxylic-acid synthase n=1 Tax=Blattabacterium cuenoti TaxID=1653831 RepID=UPI00163CBFCB|nr:2-succinyl-5-enolpyruvyl-6-hydroxy-3-cyclohexene-1-carboxylic-acid synthase [Blattabacterium cuenoti]